MTSYPTTIPELRTAIQTYDPQHGVADFHEAQAKASPVVMIVGALNALRPHIDELDEDGLRIVAGAGELVMLQNFHGLQAEGMAARDAARALLASGDP